MQRVGRAGKLLIEKRSTSVANLQRRTYLRREEYRGGRRLSSFSGKIMITFYHSTPPSPICFAFVLAIINLQIYLQLAKLELQNQNFDSAHNYCVTILRHSANLEQPILVSTLPATICLITDVMFRMPYPHHTPHLPSA